eukprot:4698154-Pyramimonas_sp.AAC.1
MKRFLSDMHGGGVVRSAQKCEPASAHRPERRDGCREYQDCKDSHDPGSRSSAHGGAAWRRRERSGRGNVRGFGSGQTRRDEKGSNCVEESGAF